MSRPRIPELERKIESQEEELRHLRQVLVEYEALLRALRLLLQESAGDG